MLISLFDSQPATSDAVANAERARAAGLHRYWAPQVMNADTMLTLGAVAAAVPDIGLGTSVMAMQTMLPQNMACLLYTSPSPRDLSTSRMPSSA